MNKSFLSLLISGCVLCVVSCQKISNDETEALKQENDSLMLVNAQTKAEFEEVLMLINEIQAGFNEIKSAENYIVVNNNIGDDLSKSTRERIASDMTLISNILKENREKINRLQKQLSNSQNESAQLKETINSLNEMMDEKTQIITNLQSELAKRDIRIAELDDAVTTLTQINASQSDMILSQDSELNRVYYAFGTSKELRENKIIEKRGRNLLKGDFNKEYFTEVDMRDITELEIGSKKADVLTTHPNGSYSIDKDSNGYLTLKILDTQLFWNTSKYLVIEVE